MIGHFHFLRTVYRSAVVPGHRRDSWGSLPITTQKQKQKTWNSAWPMGTWAAWPCEISRQSVHGVGNAAPNVANFGKQSPRRGEPFDRFLQMFGGFIRPTTPYLALVLNLTWFASQVTDSIAEKPRVSHWPRSFPCTLYASCRKNYAVDRKNDWLKNGLDVLYHHHHGMVY